MESYGTELKETPYPLIAALGAKELQTKVLQHVRTINEEFVPKLHFTSLPLEHRFPMKKEVREKHGTFPNQTQRDLEGYKIQGILKTRWLKKHHELVPAVVLLFHEFDPRWNQKDWLTQETTMRDEIEQLKKGLSGRECRVLLILVQPIDDAGVAPVNVTDERLVSLRKRLETDSKGLILLRSRDITRGSSVLAKLESSIRNYALDYYKAQSKRVKRYKKALNKTTHLPLHVRHSFKIAHYYEFRRYTTKVLQHYEAAYKAITAMPLHDQSTSTNDGIGSYQVKTMAEYINFKLCYHLIFSSNNIKAAVDQLHRHMKVYANATGPVERLHEHWEWVSRQYHVFAQLLSEAVSIRGSLPSTGLDADIYKEPYLYYSIAAKYATYRRKAAGKLGLTSSAARPSTVEKDFVVVPSMFVGGDPVVSEANAQEPTYQAFLKYRHAAERSVQHAKRVIHLLEQAVHHLSMYIADQKAPRNRLKNRLLVQLANERLAAGDFEKARADFQKAKAVYIAEHWWAQTAQILKQLLVCTFRQADTAALIDCSLQFLSPILEEYAAAKDRVRVQESLLKAWRDPTTLGPPFSSDSMLQAAHELVLDHSRPMFDAHVHFNQLCACVKEEVTMELVLQSYFPSQLVLNKLELIFNDDRYNVVIYHRDECNDLVPIDAPTNETAQCYQWSLSFLHKTARHLQLPIRVLGGKPLLRYKETRFFIGRSGNSTEFLVLTLQCEGASPVITENPRPYLVDGRVPVMGKGPGSPSFARRKSMFALNESRNSANNLNDNVTVATSALDDIDFVEEDGSGHTRGTALAILQPRARAKLELLTKESLLSGDFRDLKLRLTANEDTLKAPTIRATCDPAPPSDAMEDAFFFTVSTADPTMPYVPIALDSTTWQPTDAIVLPDLDPSASQTFSITVRSMRAVTTTVTITVAYTTKSGVQVSLEDRFEVDCQDPFTISSRFVHDFPTTIQDVRTRDVSAVIGRPVNLHGTISCCSAERLAITTIEFEQLQQSVVHPSIVTSGFFASNQSVDTVKDSDVRTFYLRLEPLEPAPLVSLGRVKVQWRRADQITTTSSSSSSLVDTWLDIPTVSFMETPLTVRMEVPSFGIEGQPVAMDLCVKNNENVFHSIRLKPLDDTDFLLAGRTNAVEELLPLDEHVIRLGLIPTKTGLLKLPQFEIVSVTYNMPLLQAEERRELFVLPSQYTTWQTTQ